MTRKFFLFIGIMFLTSNLVAQNYDYFAKNPEKGKAYAKQLERCFSGESSTTNHSDHSSSGEGIDLNSSERSNRLIYSCSWSVLNRAVNNISNNSTNDNNTDED